MAVTRAAFGVQGSGAGLRALMEDGPVFSDKVRGQTGWSWFAVLTACGFFVFENVVLHGSNLAFRSFDAPLAAHHAFALAGFSGTALYGDMGHFLATISLLLEMSTPFTCISWILLKVGGARILSILPKFRVSTGFLLKTHKQSTHTLHLQPALPAQCMVNAVTIERRHDSANATYCFVCTHKCARAVKTYTHTHTCDQ